MIQDETNNDFLWEDPAERDEAYTDSVEAFMDVGPVRRLLKESGEFFIEFFLGEELTFPVPQFHKEIWELLTNTAMQRVLLAIPRDHAKTTLSKLTVVWYFLFSSHRFCAYVSNTNTRAKDACRDIMGFLKSDNFIQVFGRIVVEKESETESVWIFRIPVGEGRWKKCILRAIGSGQSMRGINIDNQRPDIAVVDDLEDDDNTGSEQLQAKLDRWVFGPFIKALARQKKIIWLGNMLQKTSLLARLSLNQKWNPVVFGCLVRDAETGAMIPLWPDRWPIDELIEDFAEYRDLGLLETWMCEMMNMPGHGRNGFTIDQVFMQPEPMPGDNSAAFLVLDPAFGEQAHNDDSSVTVHVIRKDGLPMIAEEFTGQFSEAELFDIMLTSAMKWNAWVWGIEAVAAQRVLISLFNVYLALKQLNNHVEMIPLISGKGDPKIARIRAFIGLMAKHEYAISEGMVSFVTQMLNYSMTKKSNRDDLLDSAAYGPQMLQNYLPVIMAASMSSDEYLNIGVAKFGTEICSV